MDFIGKQAIRAKTIMPKKATKNHTLTEQEKAGNRTIASIRVVNEHAIGDTKRFKAATDIYRNKLPNMETT